MGGCGLHGANAIVLDTVLDRAVDLVVDPVLDPDSYPVFIHEMSGMIRFVSSSVDVLPIFKSDLQARLLFELLTNDAAMSSSELIETTGRPQPSVSRELSRLVDSGLLTETRIGRSLLVRANDANPAVRPLRALLNIALGPQELLREALAKVDGIEYAAIFGSFAARSLGVPGKSPDDIDVVIVGAPTRVDVYAAVSEVQDRVGREINVTFLSLDRWESRVERIVQEIRSNPVIELVDRD